MTRPASEPRPGPADPYELSLACYRAMHDRRAELAEACKAAGLPPSRTLKLLEAGRPEDLLTRLKEECRELFLSALGEHPDPVLLEASQVWYWSALIAIRTGLRLRPGEIARAAFRVGKGTDRAGLLARLERVETAQEAAQAAPAALELIGCALAFARETGRAQAGPDDPPRTDLEEMRRKPYLKAVVERIAGKG